MEAILGLLTFYFVASAIIEAGIKSIERLAWGTYSPIAIRRLTAGQAQANFDSAWKPCSKWLMVILSGLLVWKTGIYVIGILAVNALQMPEGFSIGILDPILTILLISRGSNFIHEFMEMLKSKSGGGVPS